MHLAYVSREAAQQSGSSSIPVELRLRTLGTLGSRRISLLFLKAPHHCGCIVAVAGLTLTLTRNILSPRLQRRLTNQGRVYLHLNPPFFGDTALFSVSRFASPPSLFFLLLQGIKLSFWGEQTAPSPGDDTCTTLGTSVWFAAAFMGSHFQSSLPYTPQ